MAVNENSGSDITFIKVANGQMYYGTDEHDTAAIKNEYKKSNGEVIISYRHYLGSRGSIDGRILSAGFKDLEFGTIFQITLQDAEGDSAMLQMSPGSSMLNFFINQLKMVDFNKKVIISASLGKDKKGSSLFINQFNESEGKNKWVGIKHTKDKPNGMPELGKKLDDTGEEVWDFSPINIFYAKWIKNELQDLVANSNGIEVKEKAPTPAQQAVNEVVKETPVDDIKPTSDDDDLPF